MSHEAYIDFFLLTFTVVSQLAEMVITVQLNTEGGVISTNAYNVQTI